MKKLLLVMFFVVLFVPSIAKAGMGIGLGVRLKYL
jgi:hypothetical protein